MAIKVRITRRGNEDKGKANKIWIQQKRKAEDEGDDEHPPDKQTLFSSRPSWCHPDCH